LRKILAVPVIVLGVVAVSGTAASAHQCYNANKPAAAGAQVVIGTNDEVIDATRGLMKRFEKGLIGPEGEGFHGIVAFDEDGDGVADGSTFIVGPEAQLPLKAQLRGSPTNGILNICGPQGCP
jgi:hypothetical protein